jgi:hypothetical protein
VPTVIGEGIPLFPPGIPQREFTLVEHASYSRGLLALRYVRTKKTKRKAK